MRFDLEGMLKLIPSPTFDWMRQRAKQLWPDWIEAGKQFQEKKQKWKLKKVFVYFLPVARNLRFCLLFEGESNVHA